MILFQAGLDASKDYCGRSVSKLVERGNYHAIYGNKQKLFTENIVSLWSERTHASEDNPAPRSLLLEMLGLRAAGNVVDSLDQRDLVGMGSVHSDGPETDHDVVPVFAVVENQRVSGFCFAYGFIFSALATTPTPSGEHSDDIDVWVFRNKVCCLSRFAMADYVPLFRNTRSSL